jgi:hypothetical protein
MATGIPERLMFVWTGTSFPYFARLAVESALLACPTATIELWLFGPEPTDAPHFRACAGYDRVEVRRVDLADIFRGLDAPAQTYLELFERIPASAHSARSNLVRYGLLHRHGGVYLDTDVLLVKDLAGLLAHDAFIGEELVWRVDEHRVAGRYAPWMIAPTVAFGLQIALRKLDVLAPGARVERLARRLDPLWSTPNLNNAVIGARPGASYVRRLLDAVLHGSPTIRYALGPTLVTQVARARRDDVTVLPPPVFYLEPPSTTFRYFEGGVRPLPAETLLLHFVASNHAARLADLDEATLVRRARQGVYYARGAEVAAAARALPLRRRAAEAAS